MKRNTQHVVPNPKGGWSVRKGGGARATKNFLRQSEAIDYAKNISKNQKAELLIHGKDGAIRESNSYGEDPIPPKDKK